MQEVTRSVCTDAFPAPGGFLERPGGGFPVLGVFPEKDMFENSLGAVTKSAAGATKRDAEPKFLERRFIQAATTLELEGMTAEEALAKWSEFLRKESSAKITKEGAQCGRASVHAIIFITVAYSFLQCSVRAKVYRTNCRVHEGGSALVLEITRRSGDAVAFFHAFRRASDYLLGKPMTEVRVPPLLEVGAGWEAEALAPPPALPAMPGGGHDLPCGMLGTLASTSCSDWCLQAQADFAALAASLAGTPAGLSRLLAALHEVHDALARLLLSAHIVAAYPAAVAVAAVLASPRLGAASGPAAEARARLQDAAARAAESAHEPMVRAALG